MRFYTSIALALSLVGSAASEPGVSPASVNQASDPGLSFDINKVVTTPEILPKPDVVLLVDVTGSMSPTIADIKRNLANVITTVNSGQPNAQFAVASFGDLRDPNGFQVNQGLTSSASALQAAVNSLKAERGRDDPEDWINALYRLSTGAVAFREGSSRIIVLISDETSHDPSGGHTLADTIVALKSQSVRVIGVNIRNLDGAKQASAVTNATGGIIIGSAADAVSKAIVSGLKNLDVTVKPDVISCHAGLTLEFDPAETKVSSGSTITFHETVKVASDAAQSANISCTVRFLLNGKPGGDTFIQNVTVPVNQMGCFTCKPQPGKNLCHPTTSCAPTPYGTMCLTRPGFKADGAADDAVKVQWRMEWPVTGHGHRVAVKPGTSANTLCDSKHKGQDVCKEVVMASCSAAKSEIVLQDFDQKVMGDGEL